MSWRHFPTTPISIGCMLCIFLYCTIPLTDALHHMKQPPLVWVNHRNNDKPLTITNLCPEVIYPGIATQAGTPPSVSGFKLDIGETRKLAVSGDWQGRVWGRTNCSFNAAGTGASNNGGNNGGGAACSTGDCNGIVDCVVTGQTPTTLAEFTLASTTGQAYYDISLVDGYNIPMAIVALYARSGNSSLADIPPNLTNPVCIGTASLLADIGSLLDSTLGSNSSYPLPLEQSNTYEYVAGWCPWNLQLHPPSKPGDGIYPYPDDRIVRPEFDPCFSACSKYNDAENCCTGSYNDPHVCQPSLYSRDAKTVCPDAYSFAFDDQTSTFIIPSGGGFEVIFCPAGRSTNILATMGPQLALLAQSGHVTPQLLADTQNITLIKMQESASGSLDSRTMACWTCAVGLLLALWQLGVW